MELSAYLDHIGHGGPVAPDLATLVDLHRAHLLAIPYENLDVQLGRPVTIDPAAAYDKIVRRGRGGWCYEMNGLFGWALGEIGFSVTRLCAGPMEPYSGERALGRHLVLRVDLDQPWIADVGFADGPLEPYPLAEGEFSQRQFDFRLQPLEPGWWRLHNHAYGMSPAFEVSPAFSDEALLADRCDWLQSAPDSPFVLNTVVFRHTDTGQKNLIGRKLRWLEREKRPSRLIESAAEYEEILWSEFGLQVPGVVELWPKICARHDELFA